MDSPIHNMTTKLRPAPELLGELKEELERGRVFEATLKDDHQHLYGLCDYGTQAIVIDPAVAVVDTLLHELLHRRYPSWAERRVEKETSRLLSALRTQDVQTWYRRYKRAVRKRRPVDALDYVG